DVAGARPMEAVRESVAPGERIAGRRITRAGDVATRRWNELVEKALFALIDRVGETVGIDLVDERQLHDIAEPCAQQRSGIGIDNVAGLGRRHFRLRLDTDESAPAPRLTVHARLPRSRPRRAENQSPPLAGEQDRAFQ